MDIMEILSKIGFDWRMALANLINFLIIFWLLKRFALEPIKRVLRDREEKIKQSIEDAKKAESERIMATSNYEQKMAEARKEAALIISQAHEQSENMLKKATAQTEEKVAKMLSDARSLIESEKEKMLKGLEEKTVEIAVVVAEKIIKKELDLETEKKVISELVDSN